MLMISYNCERNLYMMDTRVVLPEHEAQYACKDMQPLSIWHERTRSCELQETESDVNSKAEVFKNRWEN